jgi:hypothetical protein
VARENRAAALNRELDPTDPRWALAMRTRTQLQGGLLMPEGRRRVMRTASILGIRPFEANMIIALVQDQARRGVAGEAIPSLALMEGPAQRSGPGTLPIAALACALLAALLIIRWLLA